MSIINGTVRLLHIRRPGGEWRRISHLTVNSWQQQTAFIDTTTRDNAGFSTARPTECSGTLSFSAIVFQDEFVGGNLGYKELKEVFNNKELFEWKLEALNENFIDYGRAHLSQLSEQAPHQEEIVYSGTLQVFGKPIDIVDIQPPSTPVLTIDNINILIPSADISWTISTDNLAVTGYELRKSTTNGVGGIIDVGNVNSFTDVSLQYLTFYSYNVRAYDLAGNYSAWSSKRSFTIPIPLGVPEPEYLMRENGVTLLTEQGAPMTV